MHEPCVPSIRRSNCSRSWNSAVLKTAGSEIQFLAIHDYSSVAQNATTAGPRNAMMGRPGEFEANYHHIADLIQQNAPGRDIKLIVNEWNLFYGAPVTQSMDGAVYASRMMNGFERDGDIVNANSISDLLNGWVGGVIQASRDRVYGTTQYYAVKMYGDHLGTDRLHAEIASPEIGQTKAVDAVATRSANGREVYVKMSNADSARTIATTVSLDHFPHAKTVHAQVLAAIAPGDRNSFSDPHRVAPAESTIHCSRTCTLDLKADSVAILTFRSKE